MTETSGREKVLEEAARAVLASGMPRATTKPGAATDEHSYNIPSYAVWAFDKACKELAATLASPSTQEPALQNGPPKIWHNEEGRFKELVEQDTFTIYANEELRYVSEIFDADLKLIGFRVFDKPALRDGKVEAIAKRVEISAKRWTIGLERDDWKPSRAHIESARNILNEAAAALRTHAGESAAQSERAGLERADEAMHEIWLRWFEFYGNHFRAGNIAISAADQQAFYEIAQPILRALSAARKAGGE